MARTKPGFADAVRQESGHIIASIHANNLCAIPKSIFGPTYSKPAVRRVLACLKRVPAPARDGERIICQWGDFLRAAMKAGCVVVEVARKPSAAQREAMAAQTADPTPTPCQSGSVTVRCSRLPPRAER